MKDITIRPKLSLEEELRAIGDREFRMDGFTKIDGVSYQEIVDLLRKNKLDFSSKSCYLLEQDNSFCETYGGYSLLDREITLGTVFTGPRTPKPEMTPEAEMMINKKKLGKELDDFLVASYAIPHCRCHTYQAVFKINSPNFLKLLFCVVPGFEPEPFWLRFNQDGNVLQNTTVIFPNPYFHYDAER